LEERIEQGRFREDLFFRINVVTLRIPPLRERPEDIALLADHFLKAFRKKTGKSIKRLSPEALAALRKHSFAGNVRELENAIEHAFVMCHEREIRLEHLPSSITRESGVINGVTRQKVNEREVIAESLRRNRGNRSKVAEELGIHRSTLWRKIQMYRLDG
jgi:transcriptional regulator with PAS, ATPase and Fis domain